jgi:predicted dehydrogenase
MERRFGLLNDKNITRRRFLKKAAGTALGAITFPCIASSSALGNAGNVAAGSRITMGFIGTGGRGGALLSNFINLRDAQVVAVCDVKRPNCDGARQRVDKHYNKKACTGYNDFRQLCERSDIDAVVVASTDHWHVLHALEAVRSGKDVYCEKPLGMSVEEGQVLRQEVNRYGRVFQFGTQERSSRNSRFACEMVRSGRVGKIHKITVASRYSIASENFQPMPVPDSIDYDLWLGPAPWAPYHPSRVSNSHWWHISDYSLGWIAGCGIHTIDIATWGNGTDLTGPLEVEGTGEYPPDGTCDNATGWDVNLKFANGVTMNFTDGKRNPLGVRFEGTDGWVFVKEEHLGGKVDANPKELLKKEIGPDEVHLPVSNHHQQNFLDCVKSRARTVAPVEVAVRSDTLCQLSEIAMRLGRKLKWNPDKEEFLNDEQATRMLKRPLRSPWRL